MFHAKQGAWHGLGLPILTIWTTLHLTSPGALTKSWILVISIWFKVRNKSDQTRERILSSSIAHDKYNSPSVSMSIYILKSADYIRFRQQQPPGPIRKVIGRLLEHFRTSSSARHRQLFVFRTALDLLCSCARSKSADDGIYSRGSAHSALKECIRTPTRGGTSSSHLPYRTKAEDRRTTSTGASARNFFNCGAFWPSVTLVDQPPSLFHN